MEYGALSLLPALAAVGLCLWTQRVFLSLALSVWLAGMLLVSADYELWQVPLLGLGRTVVTIGDQSSLAQVALVDAFKVKIVMFTVFVALMVGVMSASGATRAMVQILERRARTRRGGMVATWLAGLLVFFDDYANCLVVGKSMRPLGDRLGISREKLAYIVDSTAAPIASLALISTWIGYEVGLFSDALNGVAEEFVKQGLTPPDTNAYLFFVEGLGYRFYSFFTIAFVGAIAITGRDFGPMRRAEQRAASRHADQKQQSVESLPVVLAWGAILPIVLLLGLTGCFLWQEGSAGLPQGAAIIDILSNPNLDPADVMFRSSLWALGAAVVLALFFGRGKLKALVSAMFDTLRQLSGALVVLCLAWTLAHAIKEMNAAAFMGDLLGGSLPVAWLPAVVFLVASLTSFSTGSSFTTMGVLTPMAIPLAFQMTVGLDPAFAATIQFAAAGAVLTGACWGDHCSPISDTTVLSSIGCDCDHVQHVQTQLPYALICGGVSLVLGSVAVGLGVPVWICLGAGVLVCILTVRILGSRQWIDEAA